MSAPQTPSDDRTPMLDRILAYAALALAAASVICFLVIMIASASGVTLETFQTGLWPVLTAVPWVGLPAAFAMIVTLLILTSVRRGRAARRH